jgi:ribonuclease J
LDNPEIISRGFVFEQKYGGILEEAALELSKRIQKKKFANVNVIRNTSTDFLERYFYQKTGRRPMVLPVVVEV